MKVDETLQLVGTRVGTNYFATGFSGVGTIENRTSQYYPLMDGWDSGYDLLYKTDNRSNISSMEKAVIDRFWFNPKMTNKNNGGGGPTSGDEIEWGLYLKVAKEGIPHLRHSARKV